MIANLRSMFSVALSIFIVMNAIGSASIFLFFLKGIPVKRQKQIVFRELLIALFIIILFYFIGNVLLNFLNITENIVQISGGVILFLLSLKMLFPPEKAHHVEVVELQKIKEPLIVPLAIPLIAGPAVLATVMLYSQQQTMFVMLGAISIAWLVSLVILILSSIISEKLGENGITAVERLMGFIMVLIAMQMFLSGVKDFLKS